VIYETHVKGFTKLHPEVREDLRGTYAGLAVDAAIEHLKRLGVTAVELLPCTTSRRELPRRPRADELLGLQLDRLSRAARALRGDGHARRAGARVQGDGQGAARRGDRGDPRRRLQPHGEGNHLGPMLSFKGVDNASYYRLMPDDPRYYMDFTGTGNSLNPVHPSVLRLIMDSLRYFVIDCHVDGFRFDLASALAREFYDGRPALGVLRHDPPGPGALAGEADRRAVGRRPRRLPGRELPRALDEWNGLYRDTMRDFWRGQENVADFVTRFTGSADLYEKDGRRPFASINFVTAHDGFTLADLVSYNDKHNEANGESNRDGTTTTARGTTARGVRPTILRSARCVSGSSGTS
jgi:glycogen operon protein